jgi:hypothetical protein
MTRNPDERPGYPAGGDDTAARQAAAGRLAEVRSLLAAIDQAVFGEAPKMSSAAHRARFAATVQGFFADE